MKNNQITQLGDVVNNCGFIRLEVDFTDEKLSELLELADRMGYTSTENDFKEFCVGVAALSAFLLGQDTFKKNLNNKELFVCQIKRDEDLLFAMEEIDKDFFSKSKERNSSQRIILLVNSFR